jgi:hypothetical protein
MRHLEPNVVPVWRAAHVARLRRTVLSVRRSRSMAARRPRRRRGAIAGGIAGSNVGGGNGAVIGAVIGGVAGNAVERSATTQNGVEIIVQLRDGQRRAIVQGATPDVFAPGDPVILIVTGANTRVQLLRRRIPAADRRSDAGPQRRPDGARRVRRGCRMERRRRGPARVVRRPLDARHRRLLDQAGPPAST